MIKIYSTPTCIWCAKTKEYFKNHHVKFENIDVSTNVKGAKEMVKKSGQMGVPVIDVNGEIIIGFDETKLKKAIAKSK